MDTNQNKTGQGTQGITDLTQEEQAQALLADLLLHLDAINEENSQYLAYLQEVKAIMLQLGKSQREIDDELAKLKLRQKLGEE